MNYRTAYDSALISAVFRRYDLDAATELIRRMQAACSPDQLIECVQGLRKRSARVPSMRVVLAELSQMRIVSTMPESPDGYRLADIVISHAAGERLALIAERRFDDDMALALETLIMEYGNGLA